MSSSEPIAADHLVNGPDFTPWDEENAARYRSAGYWTGEPLDRILRRGLEHFPDNTALVDNERCWTYAQLDRRVDRLAAGFAALGIGHQDKVVVQLPNRGSLVEVIFALFRIGAVPVYALPAHRLLELAHFCTISGAKAYITTDKAGQVDYRDLARRLLADTPLQYAIIDGEANNLVALDSLYREPIEQPRVDASSIALLQLSGGTTNIPKLIPRTHDDYYYSVRESAHICGLHPQSVYLAALPAAHNFPHSSPGILGTLYAGGCVVMAETAAPDTAFELIAKHRVTITALVPPLALVWMNAATNAAHDLSSLEVLQVGGAKFGSEPARRLVAAFGCKLQQVFGMAEGLVNYTRLDDPDEIVLHTQGRPISPADEIRVVDADDNEVTPGQTGELLTRGPYTIRGYFRADEHNRRAFTHDGFYRTGDVVRLDEHGYLIVEGRVKDQINRGGEKVAAEEVENQLMAHHQVHDVAVVAMPDAYLGEKTCAFVVPKPEGTTPAKASVLRRFLSERGLADYKIPDRFEFHTELPKTSFGKINKQALRILLADEPPATVNG